jgi:hypothetical protein
MAKAKIVLGGEIDVATGDELSSGLDSLRGDMRSTLAKPKRIMRPLSASLTGAQVPTVLGANAQLVIGRPAAGRVWVVTRLTVIGSDDSTALTNLVGSLYIGDDSNVGLSQCVRHGTAMPFTTTENENAYVVHDRETLFLNITGTGAVTATQVVANVLAWEYRDVDIDTQVI